MLMQTFYYLMLLTTSKIAVSLNLPGLKLQFKGQNVISFINSRNIYWALIEYQALFSKLNILQRTKQTNIFATWSLLSRPG